MQGQLLDTARRICAATVVSMTLLCAAPQAGFAFDSDAALEADGFLCTRQIARSERKYGIPLRLLGAIANTESGRRHKGLGVQVPWPWTINAAGTPYLFHTKQEAVTKVKELQGKGVKSIDVGCMQVNLLHHPDAFASLNQAFEPSFNVDYAARYLRAHYDETASWKTAVGYYHSRTPANYQKYIALVYNQWYGLAGSVARARGREYVMLNGKPLEKEGRKPEGQQPEKQQRAAKQYKSFIKNESNGQQIALVAKPGGERIGKATPANVHIVRPGDSKKNRNQDSLIRPASSAAKVQTAPSIDMNAETTPLVMNITPERVARTPKVTEVSEHKTRDGGDPRILKFVD